MGSHVGQAFFSTYVFDLLKKKKKKKKKEGVQENLATVS